ncbi:MAG: DUF2695 domain-containing protein [Pseudonocardiaceae bacterium]
MVRAGDGSGRGTAEDYLSELQATLTAPRERECLPCYVGRMLAEFSCSGTLRWSEHWRNICAPRATALADRLASRGGFCDCEVLLNVYPEKLAEEDAPPPACTGVSRRGSTRPCRPV